MIKLLPTFIAPLVGCASLIALFLIAPLRGWGGDT